MKRILAAAIEKFFRYAIDPAGMWRDRQKRLAQAERNSQLAAERLSHIATLEAQIAAYGPMQAQLAQCNNERATLALQLERAQQSSRAFENLKDEAEKKMRQAQKELAQGDVNGRIIALERETARLRQRIADLDTYFKETRGHAIPYL